MGLGDIYKAVADGVAAWEATQTKESDRRFPDQWTPADDQSPAMKIVRPDGTVEFDVAGRDIFTYTTGQGGQLWNSYSPETRARLEGQMVNAGLLSGGGFIPGELNATQHEAWDTVLDWSEYYGITPFNALRKIEQEGSYRSSGGGSSGGGGSAGPSTVTTIPDYATIAQNAKNMLRNELGRDVEDWEITLTAEEMQKQYRTASQQQLAASLAGSGEFEITDPVTVTEAYIQDQYAPEIERVGDVAQTAANHKLSMDVLTQGAGMIG